MESRQYDSQLIELIRDRFDAVDNELKRARESFDNHASTDEKYWKKIDEQQTQLSLISRVFWGLVTLISGVLGWLGLKH